MLRERIIEQYGEDCRIRQLRRTPRFGAVVFVVDASEGARITRILGAIDGTTSRGGAPEPAQADEFQQRSAR